MLHITRDDIKRIRRELIALGALLLFAILYQIGDHFLRAYMEGRLNSINEKRMEAQRLVSSVQMELDDLRHFTPIYKKYQEAGMIGDEHRLDWIEALERIQTQQHLPGMVYHFDPQQSFDSPPGISLAYYKIFNSPLKLSLQTLHEEQGLRAINDLDRETLGLSMLRSCQMTRTNGGPAHIKFDCVYDCLTLRLESPKTEGETP